MSSWTGIVLRLGIVAGLFWSNNATSRVLTEPSSATLPVQAIDSPVQDARWMAVDSVHQKLLFLTAESEEGDLPARFWVLNFNGEQESVYPLTGLSFQMDAPEVHYFPTARKAIIVVSPDPESASSILGQAHVLDISSGLLSMLPLPIGAAFSSPETERFFVLRGRGLSVVNVLTGKIEQTRNFARYIAGLTFKKNGEVLFLQTGFADGSHRLLTLDPSDYSVTNRSVVGAGAELCSLVGIDENRGLVILHQTTHPTGDEEPHSWTSVEDAQGNATSLQETEGGDYTLLASSEQAAVLYLYEQSMGQLGLYDANTLKHLQTVENFYGQLLGFDQQGRLLIASGRTLQRRDPRTFQIIQSVELDGFINLGALHKEANRVFLVVDGEDSQKLFCVDLENLQPIL